MEAGNRATAAAQQKQEVAAARHDQEMAAALEEETAAVQAWVSDCRLGSRNRRRLMNRTGWKQDG